jgi:D-methionine transport system substrate-binding protein
LIIIKNRILLKLTVLSILIIIFTGCDNYKSVGQEIAKSYDKDEVLGTVFTRIVMGVSPVPHADLMNAIKDELKKMYIDLQIREYSNYNQINTDLENGVIDANFFQHDIGLETDNNVTGYKLISLGGIHIEPMGVYSNKIKSIDNLKKNSMVSLSNIPIEQERSLLLLQNFGIIMLDSTEGTKGTILDIVKNDKNLKFIEMPPEKLASSLVNVELSVINANYALESELNPLTDSIITEDKYSPYVNVVVIREEDKDLDVYKKLIDVAQSDIMKDYIEELYKDSLIVSFK